MSYFLSPVLNQQLFDDNGDPLAGGKIATYLAQTTTPVTTYQTSSGTAHSNPIILDSAGNLPAGTQLWLQGGFAYKFVVKDANDVVLRTIDNITGINDTTMTPSQWVLYPGPPTYVSATSFTVAGDQTNIFQPKRRLYSLNTGGTIYSTVVSSTYGAPNTTVVLNNDSGSLDVGISQVFYSLLSAASASVPMVIGGDTQRVDVASAATINLTALLSTRNINITGTTSITAFTVLAGSLYFVRFAAALTLTNNANIVTNTGASITTSSGDTCTLRATAANTVEVLSYVPAVLMQQATRSMVRLNTANGSGSTNTAIRRFANTVTNVGTDITYADSASLGASFTINALGVYAITYSDEFSTTIDMGLSLNSTQLTTSIKSIAVADRLASITSAGTNFDGSVSWAGFLPAGSVIRPHTSISPTTGASPALANFTVIRIA